MPFKIKSSAEFLSLLVFKPNPFPYVASVWFEQSALFSDPSDSQPGSSAEAVGLEEGPMHTLMESHPQRPCGQHGLRLHIHSLGHRYTSLMYTTEIILLQCLSMTVDGDVSFIFRGM